MYLYFAFNFKLTSIILFSIFDSSIDIFSSPPSILYVQCSLYILSTIELSTIEINWVVLKITRPWPHQGTSTRYIEGFSHCNIWWIHMNRPYPFFITDLPYCFDILIIKSRWKFFVTVLVKIASFIVKESNCRFEILKLILRNGKKSLKFISLSFLRRLFRVFI